jgi:hypothetical protein
MQVMAILVRLFVQMTALFNGNRTQMNLSKVYNRADQLEQT